MSSLSTGHLSTGILHTGGLQTGTLFVPNIDASRQLTAGRLNGIIHAAKSNQIQPGHGYRISQTGGGTTLSVKKQRPAAPQKFPFKITTSLEGTVLKCFVNYAQVARAELLPYTSYPTVNSLEVSLEVTIGGGALNNHPLGTTAGFLNLSASTTYGIWLKGYYTCQSVSVNFWGLTLNAGKCYKYVDEVFMTFDRIEAESSYTAPNTAPSNGEVWLFLGSVAVDANKQASIVQWWKSDILLQSYLMPDVQPSSDSGNRLTRGSDGLLFAKPVVSGDPGNTITTGTDGGAFL